MDKFPQHHISYTSKQAINVEANNQYNKLLLKRHQEQHQYFLKQLAQKKKSLQLMHNQLKEKQRFRDELKNRLEHERQLKNQRKRRRRQQLQQKKRQFQEIITEQQKRLKEMDFTLQLLDDLQRKSDNEVELQQLDKFNKIVQSDYRYLKQNNSSIKITEILKLEDILLDNLSEITQQMRHQK